MTTMSGPILAVVARCVRCQTWAMDHTNEECARWLALRSDPSHEHQWCWVGEAVLQCKGARDKPGCYLIGEVAAVRRAVFSDDPYDLYFIDDDDAPEVEPREPVADDPEKRRVYNLAQTTRAIASTQARIKSDTHRLAEMKDEAAALATPDPSPAAAAAGGGSS